MSPRRQSSRVRPDRRRRRRGGRLRRGRRPAAGPGSRPQAPDHARQEDGPAASSIASGNGNVYKNGGDVTGVVEGVRADHRRAPTCSTPSSPASTSANWIPTRPASATAACPTPTASSSSIRAACTGRRSAPAACACLEGVRTPSLVAKAVMENTDHHLLVGKGAQEFARNMGFTIEDDLNTERSREAVARVEAPRRSRALPRSRSSAARRAYEAGAPDGRATASSSPTTSGAPSTATASARRARSAA